MKNTDWKPFYQHSLQLFQFLEQHTDKLFLENERTSLDYAEDTYGIYSTAQNSGYAHKLPVAPRFMHTVCRLRTADDLSHFEALLRDYQTLYAQALQQDLMQRFTKSTSTAARRFHRKPYTRKTGLCVCKTGLTMPMTIAVLSWRLKMLKRP